MIPVDGLFEGPEEGPDTESVGRDSDLASVPFSEASTVSLEEPNPPCRQSTRILVGLVQLDGFLLKRAMCTVFCTKKQEKTNGWFTLRTRSPLKTAAHREDNLRNRSQVPNKPDVCTY